MIVNVRKCQILKPALLLVGCLVIVGAVAGMARASSAARGWTEGVQQAAFGEAEVMLELTKQADPVLVQDGAPLTYTIHVTNTGNVTLTATITDILPKHVTPTGVLTWTPTITTPGGTWAQQVVVTVETGYTGSLTNKVQVTTEEGAIGTAGVTVCANYCIIYLPLITKNYPPPTPTPILTFFDFEGDCQGWGKQPLNQPPQPCQGVTPSTEIAHTGSYSLRFDALGPYSSETTQDVGVNYNAYNKKVTAFVYLDYDGVSSIPVVIYIQDQDWVWHQGSHEHLFPGHWIQVSFDMRGKTWPAPYRTLGLHFTPGDYTGPVFIDTVTIE